MTGVNGEVHAWTPMLGTPKYEYDLPHITCCLYMLYIYIYIYTHVFF